MKPYRLAFVINPIAGMGGSVGLKGTDGELAERAAALGAHPLAGDRARRALLALQPLAQDLQVLTCSGDMGERAVRSAGLDVQIVYVARAAVTHAEDTRGAAAAFAKLAPDLLLFVGGDGTARDLLSVTGNSIPLLGVPAGVKMHSAVFAASAMAAGHVARRYLRASNREPLLHEVEIMDREISLDDQHYASPSLYGMVRVPQLELLVPAAKASAATSETAALEGAVTRVANTLRDERISLVGPGSTMQMLKRQLGVEGTALGVDAFASGKCVGVDLSERSILQLLNNSPSRIVVSVVGGQGFLFGRGNQQLSSRVIRQVGRDNIVIVSSLQKLTALPGNRLLVDTGDDELDEQLAGHIAVVVSGARTVIMPVSNASKELPG